MSYYDSDEDFRKSPGLERVYVKSTPEPEPLPFIPKAPPDPVNLSPQSQKDRKKSRRRRTRPALGDTVLLSYMNPNYPDVAKRASEIALNSASHSEVSDSDMEDKAREPPDRGPRRKSKTPSRKASPQMTSPVNEQSAATLQAIAAQAQALDPLEEDDGSPAEADPAADGDDENETPSGMDDGADDAINLITSPNVDVKGLAISAPGALEPDGTEAPRPQSASSAMDNDSKPANGFDLDDTLATSPNLRDHTIPESERPLDQKLPALHSPDSPSRDAPGSPIQTRSLPGFTEIEKIAEAAQQEGGEPRVNGFHQHRQSFSSAVGPPGRSPPNLGVPVGISPPTYTPGAPPSSWSHISPVSANGETSPQEAFAKLGVTATFPPTPGHNPRRPSQASDTSPGHFGPTPESVEGSNSGAYPTSADGQRMSIDMSSRTLPLPIVAGVQHIPPHGAGSFKCDFPGCNAAPFQTQYLLNSHANVHSQNRPHYCPVAGCPRGEGGKGFKRKNEMIRHGLVHDSPGYVCPFCPDREHKYPRPDNLQRHVRVHHIDKDRDDPLLREVLAQRPEGGNRGRRRRMGT
ncbi:hypothetical protein NA57DRAFT_80783 [Rhizodiscina lignyota]|uniref:C2H2-type domain-containing protein n=1 Tax=Rhizodiscina lignyota TaxID=1504668 RepID=A0A9P4I5D2_9PEZI|nr:hypothetical protein NA57DRAFT_80783 [Rhizodiscina lignyota]